MKTSVEAVSGVEKRVRVEYPAEEVSKRIEKGYDEVRKMVPIRGFRRGKAPMAMVKRLFKDHVEADVAEHLVKESIADAVKENNLRVISPPRIDGGKIAEGEGFVFTATFEVAPDVAPAGYKGLPVVKEKAEVKDEQVEAALRELRESFGQYHTVEGRGAAESDLVEIGFSSASGGEKIESDESASLILGGGLPFGKEFEAALTGVMPGEERTVEVEYPEDLPNKKYAGKKVAFAVKVNAVREKRLPELDEDFAKNFTDVSDLADLRERMGKRLLAEAEERSRRRAEEEIRKGLLEKNPFEVPRSLVDRQVLRMIEDTADRLASQGVDLKKVNMDFDKMRERFAPNAEKAVRVSLLLDAIAKQENIDVSYPEIEAEMKEMAAAARMDFEKVRELYGDEERMDALRDRLMERKVMAFLLANAEVKEEVVNE
ncbi:MAG: trigger factor [Deltaproteobacteria bacterium]|nr:trigger factor [Deltaproteobacteria bacterium]